MPKFERINYVGLSVRDVRRSAVWYRDVLELETVHENIRGSEWPSDWDEVLLKDPRSGLLIGLLTHQANPGDEFSEFRTGLDHLEFEVSSREELEAWGEWLDARGVPHSGIKEDHILTFRDPDNIQLEFFLPKTGS